MAKERRGTLIANCIGDDADYNADNDASDDDNNAIDADDIDDDDDHDSIRYITRINNMLDYSIASRG